MHLITEIIQWAVFLLLGGQVAYLLFFSVAGFLVPVKKHPQAPDHQFIRVFIPGYKEDNVIVETARQAAAHNYPADRFEVVVVADSFSNATLHALAQLNVKVVTVSFEKSTKGKALQKAVQHFSGTPAHIAMVLDADNIMAPGVLHQVNNAFASGLKVVQAHRTAKNRQTPIALLDACTEEINNHIFRRGHVAAGMPSALIGSGMAFDYSLFSALLQNIGDTAGEDKEMEFRIIAMGHAIGYLPQAWVYDEKVSKKEVLSTQRSRWVAMQLEFLVKYFPEGVRQLFKGNIAFFDKVVQMMLLPRVMLLFGTGLWWLVCLLLVPAWLMPASIVVGALAMAMVLGIPAGWVNKQFFYAILNIPIAFVAFAKAIYLSGKARNKFVHTPHGDISN